MKRRRPSSARLVLLVAAGLAVMTLRSTGQTNSAPEPAPEPVLIEPSTDAAPAAAEAAPTPEAPPAADEAQRDVIGVVDPGGTAPAAGISPVGENLINVSVDNESLENVVNMFTRISGANIIATAADLKGTVTVNLTGVEWKPALGAILELHNLALVEKMPGSGVYTIQAKPAGQQEALVVDTLFFHFTTVPEIMPIVSSMIRAVTNASISSFPSRNALVIKSTEANLHEIRQMLSKMDVPGKQVCVETQFLELSDEASKKLGIRWDSLDEFGMKLNMGPFNYDKNTSDGHSENTVQNAYNRSSDSRTAGDNSGIIDSSKRYYDIDGSPLRKETITYMDLNGDGLLEPQVEVTPTRTLEDNFESSIVNNSEDSSGSSTEETIVDTFNRQIEKSQSAVLEFTDFQMVLSALKKTSGVTIISNPKIIVASGATNAFFSVGEREPIIKTEVTRGTQDSPGDKITAQLDTAINTDNIRQGYLQTGIDLRVTPTVKTDDMIEAEIAPSLKRKTGDKVVDVNSWPLISVKEIRSRFTLRSGQTVAIGGLTDTQDDTAVTKVPLLGDIPLLGKYLFSHKSDVKRQVETIIFVTLALASPDGLYEETGIPENAELVHKERLRAKQRRAQFQDSMDEMRAATEAEAAQKTEKAKSRLLKRK